jgi:NAD(P)H-dependent flavin oxidoreductase YrpB (nitropropane dioxygenase family)
MLGTRFITSAERPVHRNVKQAITNATEAVSPEPVKTGITMRFVRNEFAEAVARGEVIARTSPAPGRSSRCSGPAS